MAVKVLGHGHRYRCASDASGVTEMKVDRILLIHLAVIAGFTALAVGAARAAEPSADRQEALVRMVRQDCGSCHGMTLKGGLGPALLPETLRDKPVDSLVATVLQGRPGTPMSGWQPFMTEPEARWIVARLQAGFPPLAAARLSSAE